VAEKKQKLGEHDGSDCGAVTDVVYPPKGGGGTTNRRTANTNPSQLSFTPVS
jgi:hypothetical protein